MSVRDEFRKVAADLRAELAEGDEHLHWLLGEVERQLGLSDERIAAVAAAPVVVPDQEDDTEENVDLSKLTVPELKALADERGIDLGDATKKADILAAIEAAGAEPDGGGDGESEEDFDQEDDTETEEN